MKNKKELVIFENFKIRWHYDEKADTWYFSVVDVVFVLTDSTNPTDYLKKLRKRDKELGSYIGTNCPQVEMSTEAGKKRKTLAGSPEHLLRIIQSIPSKKAEPFKIWLARVGYERIREVANPELAAQRAREIYRAKGYPEFWIEKRMRGIEVRETLTNEWKDRGAKNNLEFAILTNEILKGTFDMTAGQYKKIKGLKTQNLRDHMDDMELILTMLGEATTTRFHRDRDSQGMDLLAKDAKDGGDVAGRTRNDIEKKSGKPVISNKNFLPERKIKRLKKKYDKN